MWDSVLSTRRAFLVTAIMQMLILARKGAQANEIDVSTGNQTLPVLKAKLMMRPAEYCQVSLAPGLQKTQLEESISTLMLLSNDALLKPVRARSGLPAPGANLGGWYAENPNYDWRHGTAEGFAPAHSFGQWLSALARYHASSNDSRVKAKVESLVTDFGRSITFKFFVDARFPAYTYDKMLIGLVDAYRYCGCAEALVVLNNLTRVAEPYLPAKAVDRLVEVEGRDASYTWDESYTLAENLFIAYQIGAGEQYLELAQRFLLDETFFEPLAAGKNVLPGKHAYSYMNALSSAMQAYLTLGSRTHLVAALNAFEFIQKDQSYATGGWGPDELFQLPGSDFLFASLSKSHHSFETPCGAYAHMKLMSYLISVTGDSKYGDSTEKVMYNTVLGAKPLNADGHAFYYADYNNRGQKSYSEHIFPCCAGTLPQVSSDYAKHAYFLDEKGIIVNLYLNSQINFESKGEQVSLVQSHHYPVNDAIAIRLSMLNPLRFAIRLRIPAWANARSLALKINGVGENILVKPGKYLSVERLWKEADTIELTIAQLPRLEAIDSNHPGKVALLVGSRVLFAIGDVDSTFTRAQLFSIQKQLDDRWVAQTNDGVSHLLLPYTAICDQPYTTYLTVQDANKKP